MRKGKEANNAQLIDGNFRFPRTKNRKNKQLNFNFCTAVLVFGLKSGNLVLKAENRKNTGNLDTQTHRLTKSVNFEDF